MLKKIQQTYSKASVLILPNWNNSCKSSSTSCQVSPVCYKLSKAATGHAYV